MNSVQRLFSNAILSFVANIVAKGSDTLLFIGLGRLLGPEKAGEFALGKTYFAIVFTLSAWGLHELLVREVASRRDESGRYFVNYLVIRIVLSVISYAALLAVLSWLLPYSADTKVIIRIIALTIFPEAVAGLCQALFLAHERMGVPALAAFASGGAKISVGWWLLTHGAGVWAIAWVIPVGASFGLLVYLPAVLNLLHQTSRSVAIRFNLRFAWEQLHFTPGFMAIGVFYTLDFQTDAFLLSLYLSKTEIGWYGAAQTIMLGFWMLAIAIRMALYPVMTRYRQAAPRMLEELYQKASLYLLIFILPITAGISVLAEPITVLIFKDAFIPTAAALQLSIWAIVFAFLNVPCTILMLIFNRQKHTAWISGLSMVLNVSLNLWLLPVYGINASALARSAATFLLFLLTYRYVEQHIAEAKLFQSATHPVLATILMAILVWNLRTTNILWSVFGGVVVYVLYIGLSGVISSDDWGYFRQLVAPREDNNT